MREWEIKGWGSSDNDSPYPEHEQKGREAQPKAGIPSNHSENVEQACEYGEKTTPPTSTAPSGATATGWRDWRSTANGVAKLGAGWCRHYLA